MDMRPVYDAMRIKVHLTGPQPGHGTLLGKRGPRMAGADVQGQPRAKSASGSVRVVAPKLSLPLSVGDQVPSSGACPSPPIQQCITNVFAYQNAGGPDGRSVQLSSGLTADLVTAYPVHRMKEWHQTVTPEFRNDHVYKLAHAIFPHPRPGGILDRPKYDLAKMIEANVYQRANTKSEYFVLLAREALQTLKKWDEKRRKSKEQQQLQQAGVDVDGKSEKPEEAAEEIADANFDESEEPEEAAEDADCPATGGAALVAPMTPPGAVAPMPSSWAYFDHDYVRVVSLYET